jgi:hypothetical protein
MDMDSKRIKGADEENTAFGLPAKALDEKSGFKGEVAKEEVQTGNDRRLRPSEKKDIPQESLASRIDKIRKK